MLDLATFVGIVHKHTPIDAYLSITRIGRASHTATSLAYEATAVDKLLSAVHTFAGANVFLRVTPLAAKPKYGRGLEADSLGSSVLWVDYDCYGDQMAGLLKLARLAKPPTVIVDSGGGLQAYWQLDRFETDIAAIKARNKGLYQALSTDNDYADSCYDLARVLRLPESTNYKYDPPKLARVVHYEASAIYSLADFTAAPIDDTPALVAWDSEELPTNFLEQVKELDKKLYGRLTTGKDAPTKANGQIDRSRNDAYCALRLLGLGYQPPVILSALMSTELSTGLKYNTTQRYDYVVMTVNAAVRQFKSSPDQFFIKGKFQATSMASTLQGAKHQFIYTASELWQYNGGYFVRGAEPMIKAEIAKRLGDRWSTFIENEVIEYLKATNYKPTDDCNQQSDQLINCANGMLDLDTGALLQHDPRYLSLYQLPASYNPDCDTTEVDTVISQIIPADCIPFLWEFLGSTLYVSHYWPKALLMIIGPGDSGKSTILRFIQAILGKHNCSAVTLQSLADNRFLSVRLYARLANIYADLDQTEVGNVGQIKALTGDDTIYGEEKFKPGFTFRNNARLIFSANDYPMVRNPDQAYFNRLNIIRTGNVFKGKAANPDIDAIMHTANNLSAALLRMYQGLQRLRTNKEFTPSHTMQAAHSEYQLVADSVAGFLSQCQFSDEYQTPKKQLFQAYKDVCKFAGRTPVTENSFYRRVNDHMSRLGITEQRPMINNDRIWVYQGIKPPTDHTYIAVTFPSKQGVTN
jgi:P4 family phage/plasmid primase-like protien